MKTQANKAKTLIATQYQTTTSSSTSKTTAAIATTTKATTATTSTTATTATILMRAAQTRATHVNGRCLRHNVIVRGILGHQTTWTAVTEPERGLIMRGLARARIRLHPSACGTSNDENNHDDGGRSAEPLCSDGHGNQTRASRGIYGFEKATKEEKPFQLRELLTHVGICQPTQRQAESVQTPQAIGDQMRSRGYGSRKRQKVQDARRGIADRLQHQLHAQMGYNDTVGRLVRHD